MSSCTVSRCGLVKWTPCPAPSEATKSATVEMMALLAAHLPAIQVYMYRAFVEESCVAAHKALGLKQLLLASTKLKINSYRF